MSDQGKVKHYENQEIKVTWKPSTCIHSTLCWKGMMEVFNPKKRPWVDLDGKDAQSIARQIDQCPSGALSYEWKTKNTESEGVKPSASVANADAKIADTKPKIMEIEGGKPHAWCACGHSEDQPWCDGSHKGSGLKPLVFKEGQNSTKAMCMCKQTANPPYCDGTHSRL